MAMNRKNEMVILPAFAGASVTFRILEEGSKAMVIADLDSGATVTNNAQSVIEYLNPYNERVFYIDTAGRLDELEYTLRKDGSLMFTGFRNGPKDRVVEIDPRVYVGF